MEDEKVSIEVDLGDIPRAALEILVKESCERNVSINQIISDRIEKFVTDWEAGNESED